MTGPYAQINFLETTYYHKISPLALGQQNHNTNSHPVTAGEGLALFGSAETEFPRHLVQLRTLATLH